MTTYMGGDTALFFSLGIVILTGLVGAKLAKSQGFQIIRKVQESLAQGKIPAKEIAEGFLVLVGGVLLFAPGYLTDIIGLSFLFPLTRPFFAKGLLVVMSKQNIKANIQFGTFSSPFGGQSKRSSENFSRRRSAGSFTEGEVIDITPESER